MKLKYKFYVLILLSEKFVILRSNQCLKYGREYPKQPFNRQASAAP